MEQATVNLTELVAHSKRYGKRLLTIWENRLGLLALEVREEQGHLLHIILLALSAAVFGLLAAITLTAAIVILFWNYSPFWVLLGLTGLYILIALCLFWRLSVLLRNWKTFPETMRQLKQDQKSLKNTLS